MQTGGRMTPQLVLSLFPGIGLLDRAFELEGFCVVRGPDVLWGGDIRNFHPPRDKFDGVIGGPPCQAFSSLSHLVRHNGHQPKFGNLIPEFERCITEARPQWFLMENVRAAPVPHVDGYVVRDFLFNNAWVPGDDGLGQEQERLRRFSFGVQGEQGFDLRRWLQPATLMLPDRSEPITGGHDKPPSVRDRERTRAMFGDWRPTRRECRMPVTSSDGSGRVRQARYRLTDACRLQGLPEDFLAHSPFTADGKLKAVANGVPLPLGRVIAQSIKNALAAGKC